MKFFLKIDVSDNQEGNSIETGVVKETLTSLLLPKIDQTLKYRQTSDKTIDIFFLDKKHELSIKKQNQAFVYHNYNIDVSIFPIKNS